MDLSIFKNLKSKDLKREGLFVAEGPLVVRRLLDSNWELHSILISNQLLSEFEPLISGRCAFRVLSENEISEIVGYPFHRGLLAAGRRPNALSLDCVLLSLVPASPIVVVPLVTELENMGTIIRNAAAFGVGALLYGTKGVDPLDRRVIRVSMGNVFRLPIVQVPSPIECCAALSEHGYELVGTVLDSMAVSLKEFKWSTKTALVLGNEFSGISDDWRQVCSRFVTIPMASGVDSINLGVASGVFMNAVWGG